MMKCPLAAFPTDNSADNRGCNPVRQDFDFSRLYIAFPLKTMYNKRNLSLTTKGGIPHVFSL